MSWRQFLIAAIAITFAGWYGFWFFKGVYWAATGKPMPPKPQRRL